jgi:hypothetical protein
MSRKASAAPAAPRIFDGEKEARLVALAGSWPPEAERASVVAGKAAEAAP